MTLPHIDTSYIIMVAIAGSAYVLAKVVESPEAHIIAKATADKLAAEAELAEAKLNSENNYVLKAMVYSAMNYAENHESEILANGKSKIDYVLSFVAKDPRFAPMALPLVEVSHLIEEVYSEFFAKLAADKSALAK